MCIIIDILKVYSSFLLATSITKVLGSQWRTQGGNGGPDPLTPQDLSKNIINFFKKSVSPVCQSLKGMVENSSGPPDPLPTTKVLDTALKAAESVRQRMRLMKVYHMARSWGYFYLLFFICTCCLCKWGKKSAITRMLRIAFDMQFCYK